MKKPILIIAGIIMICTLNLKAQITCDTILPPLWDAIGSAFCPVQISENETKYVLTDTTTNTFSIYNMDFTPFILNIAVPSPFRSAEGDYFHVYYITRTLFDNNSDDIEYAFSACSGHPDIKFYIMRTNGDILFERDSTLAPFMFGATTNGSEDIRPIMNTSSGLKLFLYGTVSNKISIYSLPGQLPSNIYKFPGENVSYIKIYPNPATNTLTFEINPPDNLNEYELLIFNNSAEQIKREIVTRNNFRYKMDVSDLSSGTYFFSLITKDKTYQNGKFIITK